MGTCVKISDFHLANARRGRSKHTLVAKEVVITGQSITKAINYQGKAKACEVSSLCQGYYESTQWPIGLCVID